MKKGNVRQMVLAGLLISLGILLPIVFHVFEAGGVFLPMHFPILLAGIFLDVPYALLAGLITPLLSSFLTGMPPAFPVLPFMAVELTVYAVSISILHRKLRLNLLLSLITAMFLGRVAAGAAVWVLIEYFAAKLSEPMTFLVSAAAAGLPGIIIQLVTIPLIVIIVEKLPFSALFKRPETEEIESYQKEISYQKEYFNKAAGSWDEICNHDPGKLEKIIEAMAISACESVLDAGTGTGVLLPYLYARVGVEGKITAVDISEEMIAKAREKYSYENLEFITDDVLGLKDKKGSFDLIACYSMFPHFVNQKQAIKTLAGMLKNGGRLAICHSQSREAINNMHSRLKGRISLNTLPAARTIERYFKEAGLKTSVEVDNENLFVMVGVKEKD